jgi:L-fucose isomerase-like protein
LLTVPSCGTVEKKVAKKRDFTLTRIIITEVVGVKKLVKHVDITDYTVVFTRLSGSFGLID